MSVTDRKLIGKRLRELREESGISQNDLSGYLNITSACVANWENGVRTPDINVLGTIAEKFAVSVDYVCCRTNQRNYFASGRLVRPDLRLDLSPLKESERKRLIKYYEFLRKNA